MGSFGHILLEGYCFAEENDSAIYPCKSFGFQQVGYYCLLAKGDGEIAPCAHFSFCKCSNYLVMTDDRGLDMACTPYLETDQERIKALIEKYDGDPF